jgi:hypothetical protein
VQPRFTKQRIIKEEPKIDERISGLFNLIQGLFHPRSSIFIKHVQKICFDSSARVKMLLHQINSPATSHLPLTSFKKLLNDFNILILEKVVSPHCSLVIRITAPLYTRYVMKGGRRSWKFKIEFSSTNGRTRLTISESNSSL